MGDTVLYDVADGVATITLNRPDRLNAWTEALGSAYFDRLRDASLDAGVRAIVVTGAGRGFCAGADMELLQEIGADGDGVGERLTRRPMTFPLTVSKPVVAAVNGACAGVGFVQALYADVRFAAAGAKFTTAFSRRGLVAEHGASWLLPRLIGGAGALELLLSGRVFLAEEAHALGLVSRVLPPDELIEATHAYARELAAQASPASLATIKRAVHRDFDTAFPAAVAEADRLMVASVAGADFQEGVASFVERRAPAFEGLSLEPGAQ